MFNKRVKVKDLLEAGQTGHEVTVMGWVRTFRNTQFIALNDGSCNTNLQVVVELGKFDYIIASNILHHVPDPALLLNRLSSWLVPNSL